MFYVCMLQNIYSIGPELSLQQMSMRFILLILFFKYSISLLTFFLLYQFLIVINFCFIYFEAHIIKCMQM